MDRQEDTELRKLALDHAVRMTRLEEIPTDTVARAQTFYEFLTHQATSTKKARKK